MPSDTSHINSEVASSYPTYIMDSDIHDHCDDNDYNHYSTFEEQDFSEHDHSDFYDDPYSHDTNFLSLFKPPTIASYTAVPGGTVPNYKHRQLTDNIFIAIDGSAIIPELDT